MTVDNNQGANPLLVVAGNGEERTYHLGEAPLLIGRGRDCDIRLPGQAISRHHARLRRTGEGCLIEDLESTNGLFVAGERVAQHTLRPTEVLTIGGYELRLTIPNESDQSSPDQGLEAAGESLATSTLDPEESLLLADRLDSSRQRNLQVLIGIALEINTHQDLESLVRYILQRTRQAIPAERAVIAFGRPASGTAEGGPLEPEPWPSMVFDADEAIDDPRFELNLAVMRQVWQERIGLFKNDLVLPNPPEPFGRAGSPATVSILAVPILTRQRTLGLLSLQSTRPGFRFDQQDLELVMAIAGIAALAVESVKRIELLEAENRYLAKSANDHLIGQSPQIQFIRGFIAKVAPTSSTVLLNGESGTGKEVVARAIHAQGLRAEMPFVAINCAALNEQLLESELFGHEKGAFTGAVSAKKGKLEVANGGTLFLDEIGEMSLAIQARLLRVIQERVFEKVGGVKPLRADIRIIAATNRDLLGAVSRNQFREDLFYRLNVVTLTLPPLRERPVDIPLLAHHFAILHGRSGPRRVIGVAPPALEAMINYDWPGNIRELGNVIERAIVLGVSDQITLADLPFEIRERAKHVNQPAEPPAESVSLSPAVRMPARRGESAIPAFRQRQWREAILEMKRSEVRFAIKSASGNLTGAAAILGIHSTNLHRLIRRLGLRDEVDQMIAELKRARRG